MKFKLLLFIMLLSNNIFGITIYSIVNNASWSNGTHWSLTSGGGSCGCTPNASTDNIIIETNSISSTGVIVFSGASITIKNNSTLTINGNTQFKNGSTVLVNVGSTMIINGSLTNNNNSNNITINGTLTVNGNYTGGNGSAIIGTGSLSTTGTAIVSGSGAVFGGTGSCNVGPCSSSPSHGLPIELLYFNISNNIVNWSTGSETNNDYFLLESSKDGEEFKTLGTIKGAGNSISILNYSYNIIPTIDLIYYRLKQIDYDGKFTYSDIIINSNKKFDFNIFPNPSDGQVVNFKSNRDSVSIEIYDIYNLIFTGLSTDVRFDLLKPGIYFVVINNKSEIIKKKLIIN
jgi:hypothetical protein